MHDDASLELGNQPLTQSNLHFGMYILVPSYGPGISGQRNPYLRARRVADLERRALDLDRLRDLDRDLERDRDFFDPNRGAGSRLSAFLLPFLLRATDTILP